MEVDANVLLPSFCRALEDEIQEAQKQKSGHLIVDGRVLDQAPGSYLYAFIAESDFHPLDDSPVEVWIGATFSRGMVSSFDGQTIVLELDEFLGEQVPQATLFSQPWYLLDELRKFLLEQAARSADEESLFDLPLKVLGKMQPSLGYSDAIVEEAIRQVPPSGPVSYTHLTLPTKA